MNDQQSKFEEQKRMRAKRHTFALGSDQRQYDHEVLDIARVVRVVKGGRRFRFRATVLIGDRSGRVGMGIGKSRDVQDAIRKAQDAANRNVIVVPIDSGTIAHAIEAKYKGGFITMRPARAGTGIVAGGVVRMIADLAGIQDVISKAYGSSNKISNARAALKALTQLKG